MKEIRLCEITKSFRQVRAVDHVNVVFRAGEIHAILGENGAGKSTLMHILSGLYRPDAGQILIDNQPQTFSSPRDARAIGIAMVHQHFMLVPTLTAAENIFLALPSHMTSFVRRRSLIKIVKELANAFRVAIDSFDTPVATLPIGVQQRIEILKALVTNAQCLILDEPTAVLTPTEVDHLFASLERLKQKEYLIILITHKIPEVLSISDQISVLRRGRLIVTQQTVSCTGEQLTDLMLGDLGDERSPSPSLQLSLEQYYPSYTQTSPPLLSLENISGHRESSQIMLRDVSLRLYGGEIIGIAGVDGNGQAELAEILIGLRTPACGTIKLRGQPIPISTPANFRIVGISFIPQDRRREGLALPLTIAENLLLNVYCLANLTQGAFLPPSQVQLFAKRTISQFGITPPFPTLPVSTLSGGNQQKVVIARELAYDPPIIIAANPTRGLDIAATQYVHGALRASCSRRAGVILISTDLDEILALSNRIYVLYQGQLLGPVDPITDGTQIGRMMTGTWTPS